MEIELNEAQLEAVTATEGYVRVIAGAGSGKTRALSHRFAYLVNEAGILPGSILCVTFTSKSANEMRQRIHKLTGDNDTGLINTFHGFCVSVLQEDSNTVAYPKSFLVLDNSDIDAMLSLVYEERGITLRDMTFSRARDVIEMRKLTKEPRYYELLVKMSSDELRGKYLAADAVEDIIFYGYLYQEKKCFGLDYNDLIKFVLRIFESDEGVKLKWQKRLEYIMIDEFQDIDKLQYRLMEVLCGYHGNLFVVGDPDQTIYTWRGANVHYLLDFDKHFPGTKTIMMNQNYRSTPQLVSVANTLISKNSQRLRKDLVSMRASGLKPVCHHAHNAAEEAAWVADQVECLVSEGIKPRDICVLYRAHFVTRNLEAAFNKREIPFQIYSGVQFFDRREIKDALSYLRMVLYHDDLSFLRIVNAPKRNMGERRIAFLKEHAEKYHVSLYDALCANLDEEPIKGTGARAFVELIEGFSLVALQMNVSELLAAVMDKSGYERALRTEGSQERLDNLAELRQSIYEYETSCGEEASLPNYLSHVALYSNADFGLGKNKVRFMTVHAAKGLEFSQVFICGMNEGVFPTRRVKTLAGMEEERRLAFVALTRAQDQLYLSCADGSNHDGTPRYPSRFVLDIAPELLSFTELLPESLVKDAKAFIRARTRKLKGGACSPAFSVGVRVKHAIFGTGEVVDIDADKSSYVIAFEGMDTTRSIVWQAKLSAAE